MPDTMKERPPVIDSYLCIGGPYDGQRIEPPPGHFQHFTVTEPIEPFPSVKDFIPSEDQPTTISVRRVDYVKQFLSGYSFYTPSDQRPEETVRLLLEKYNKP